MLRGREEVVVKMTATKDEIFTIRDAIAIHSFLSIKRRPKLLFIGGHCR